MNTRSIICVIIIIISAIIENLVNFRLIYSITAYACIIIIINVILL